MQKDILDTFAVIIIISHFLTVIAFVHHLWCVVVEWYLHLTGDEKVVGSSPGEALV